MNETRYYALEFTSQDGEQKGAMIPYIPRSGASRELDF